MQKVVSEMVKTQRELHIALRDRETNEQGLKAALDELKTASPPTTARENVARLEDAAANFKAQTEELKDRLAECSVQLKEAEAKERSAMYSGRTDRQTFPENKPAPEPVAKPAVTRNSDISKPKTSYRSPSAGEDAFANTLAKV